MQKSIKRTIALVLSLMMVATMFCGAFSASADADLIDVQFNSLDPSATINWPSGPVAVDGLEGESAMQTTFIGNEVMLHMYSPLRGQGGTDITYAAYAVFDFWVEDGAAFSAAVQAAGDCGINMDTEENDSAWGESGGRVTAADLKAAMADLKDGWNHIIAPINVDPEVGSECYNLSSIRLYFAGADALVGMTLAVDDFCFAELAALEDNVAKRNAAKDVTIAIRNLPELDALALTDEDAVNAAATAYDAVDADYIDLVKDTEKLDALRVKMAAMKEAAIDPSNQVAADAVIALIAALPEEITLDAQADVEAARAAYDALTETQQVLVNNIGVLLDAEKTIIYLTPMDFQFAALNGDASYLITEGTSGEIIFDNFLEGDGALKVYANGKANNFFVHIYRVKHTENPAYEIVGGEYLTFDVFVSKNRLFTSSTIAAAGSDSSINMNDSDDVWGDNEYGVVQRPDMQAMFRGLKSGWNHVVLPIDRTVAQGDKLWVLRMFHTHLKMATDGYIIIDDVRVMNEIATLTILPERNKAKDATLAIRNIPALDVITVDDQALVTAAAEAYAAVADDYKGVVVNAGYIAEAQAKIDALSGPSDQDIADVVIAEIAALNVQSLDDKAAVEAARASFEALTDAQKALVNNVAALEAAEAAIAELQAAADKAAADKAAADAVIAQIAALDVQSLDDKAAVEAARAAFEALTDDQKVLVDNVAALETAEAAIAELQAAADKAAADKAAADAVIAEIAALDVQSLDDKAAVEAARAAFEALTDDQKVLVDNVAALETAEATIAELQAAADKAAADKAAADAVIAQIAALDVQTLDDKAAVEAARAAFEALTDDQKVLVDNVAALETAEAAIAELQAAADKAAADKAAADAVIAQIAALDVQSLDDKAAVEAARAAFEALTDDQKALVDNVAALETAEAKIAELERPVIVGPIDGKFFYENGDQVLNYQVVIVDGAYYFVGDYNAITTNATYFMSEAMLAGTGLDAGYYTFAADGTMTVADGICNGRYYEDGALAGLYQVVVVDGVAYFVGDGYNVVVDSMLYVTDAMAGNTGFAAGYYTFDANGAMTAANGVINDKVYVDGVLQAAYQVVVVDGEYYFISDYNKIAKNTVLYLGARFANAAGLAEGYYAFDANGVMTAAQ